ncbi:MAG: hypothetical protein JW931_08715 [Methanomicrobiaceae archaeon]|nr:hypothetical protein [Methanomicrobiaceae archaeon]
MTIDPGQLAIAMGGAIILVAVIIVIANYIHWFGRQQIKKRAKTQKIDIEDFIVPFEHFILMRVLLDKKGHASLSTFQFLLWTILISVLYITLWFLNFLNGEATAPSAIPAGLIALMGISVGVPIANKVVMTYKKNKPRAEGEEFEDPNYSSMLEEEGKPSLLRLQMFLWTLAAIVIYFGSFMTEAFSPGMSIYKFTLPPVDPTLLYLMGLSQTGYLGSKAYAGTVNKTGDKSPSSVESSREKTDLNISNAILNMVPSGQTNVTILGSGFGTYKDTILIENERIATGDIQLWHDTKIEFILPEETAPGRYKIKIIKDDKIEETEINVIEPQMVKKFYENAAKIINITLDQPGVSSFPPNPKHYLKPGERYNFFFEYEVPPEISKWNTWFNAEFRIDGKKIEEKKVLRGHLDGENYSCFTYVFKDEGKYNIEICGINKQAMIIEVKELPAK